MPDNRLPTNQSQLDIVNKLDEIKDAIAQGGGGGGTGGHTIIDENGNSMTARAGLQFVGANVSDDATNNKTIVDISGGGGVYIEKTLWEDANGLQFAPNNIQTITLSESLNKYDFIYVDVSSVADSGYHNQNILAVSSLYDENDGYNGVVCIGGNINLATSFAKVDNTHLKFIGFSSANPLIVWKVVGIKVSGDYYAPIIYSTEEREIGVWTDGKPLYAKTVDCGALPNRATKTIAHNIANVDRITFYKGSAVNGTSHVSIDLPYTDNSTQYIVCVFTDRTNITIITGADMSSYTNGFVTLYYTKSTDVAGSGSWTPQGVPTHHYSTDEQIIGTWIDGSTIYEKTITKDSISTGNNSIAHGISNFDTLVDIKGNMLRHDGKQFGIPTVHPTDITWDVGIFDVTSTDCLVIIGTKYVNNYAIDSVTLTIQYTKSS